MQRWKEYRNASVQAHMIPNTDNDDSLGELLHAGKGKLSPYDSYPIISNHFWVRTNSAIMRFFEIPACDRCHPNTFRWDMIIPASWVAPDYLRLEAKFTLGLHFFLSLRIFHICWLIVSRLYLYQCILCTVIDEFWKTVSYSYFGHNIIGNYVALHTPETKLDAPDAHKVHIEMLSDHYRLLIGSFVTLKNFQEESHRFVSEWCHGFLSI